MYKGRTDVVVNRTNMDKEEERQGGAGFGLT
jgi:hypothetical protein